MNPTTPEPPTLAQNIATTHLPPNTIALWWLGQAGVVLRDASSTIIIDPFLSEHPDRLVAAPFSPASAPTTDYVLCTHEHIDHFDAKTVAGIAQAMPQTRFVVPQPMSGQVSALGIAPERIISAQAYTPLALNTIKIFPVPALHGLNSPPTHYDFGFDEQTGEQHYRYLGYVVEMAGVRIYHAGDTLIYDGMVEHLRSLHIDIALLPINGRSYFREQKGLVGNMDEREAADLAAAIGVKMLIPVHYDMFAANLGRPAVLLDYMQEKHLNLTCVVLAYGQRYTYMA